MSITTSYALKNNWPTVQTNPHSLGEKVLGKVIPEGELDRLVGSGRG